MSLFRFHLRTPAGFEDDDIGLECPNLETAYLEACRSIPPISADLMSEGVNPLSCTFEITDAAGETLMEVPFDERLRDAQRPMPPPRCGSPGRGAHGSAHRTVRLVETMRLDILALVADARAAREAVQRSRALLRGDAID